MKTTISTTSLYLLASIAASLFWVSSPYSSSTSNTFLKWILLFASPLLFAFAYPKYLFSPTPAEPTNWRTIAKLHAVAAAAATIVFAILGSAFWKNPLRDSDSILFLFISIAIQVVFLVAALSLLLKGKNLLLLPASLLFWPSLLVAGLATMDRFFQVTSLRSVFCFPCLIASVLFAFAAGSNSRRPSVAHICAFAGLTCVPWIYWTTLQGSPLGNIWLLFNLPDSELSMYDNLDNAKLTILSIVLIVLAISVAAFRLLPARWTFRGIPLRDCTWPAFSLTFLFLAVWFSQSVMPYRLPGAVDYAGSPIAQILHVEKHGLRFHESRITLGSRFNDSETVSFLTTDRRLFQYRLSQTRTSGRSSNELIERAKTVLQSFESDARPRHSDSAKPLRAWNADGWYILEQKNGFQSYTSDTGTPAPPELVSLFNELQKIPHEQESPIDPKDELKDICLGFCYDPLSGLGFLYSNHRCHYDPNKRDDVCR